MAAASCWCRSEMWLASDPPSCSTPAPAAAHLLPNVLYGSLIGRNRFSLA